MIISYSRLWTVVLLILVMGHAASAQPVRVLTLADSLIGPVGGVAVDRVGLIYSADFRDTVWRIYPDGRTEKFATGFYGASGNTIDAQGYLFQSSFAGNFISRVDRNGTLETWVDEGLSGPVGVTTNSKGELFVCNCQNNTIARVGEDRVARLFASSDLLSCPNGITVGPEDELYVVNFNDGNMLRIDSTGAVSEFALIPGGGNGHVALARGNLYVTSFMGHQLYRVSMAGEVTLVAGSGQRQEVDGEGEEASFSFPNGIAAGPQGDRLYINDYVNRTPPTVDFPPVPLQNIRLVRLATFTSILTGALQYGGIEGMVNAYRDFKTDPATAGLPTELEVNGLGYFLMTHQQLDAAIRIFELNAETYPKSANTHDSLGEAYMNAERFEKAITSYRKSLEINPANQNAKDMIDRIAGR